LICSYSSLEITIVSALVVWLKAFCSEICTSGRLNLDG
jgi:hypothetical protein